MYDDFLTIISLTLEQQNRTHGTDKKRKTKHEERERERERKERWLIAQRQETHERGMTPCDFLPMGKVIFRNVIDFPIFQKFFQMHVLAHGQILHYWNRYDQIKNMRIFFLLS